MKTKASYFRIASFSSKKSNDKAGFECFSIQRSLHCAPSIVTRTRLCCYITFQCDIARDWKATCVHNMAAKRRQGLLDNFFTIVSKMPKGSVQHFDTSIQSQGWLKGSFSQHKTTFKRVIELEWPLPGSTAGKICWKLVELGLTAGYPGTSQLLVISAGFSSKTGTFYVFSGEIGP